MDGELCPVCGKYRFPKGDLFDICPVCGWQDDNIQEKEPDYRGGANVMSLNQARKAWKEGKKVY